MNKINKVICLILVFFGGFIFSAAIINAQEEGDNFNPNYIIGDEEILDYNSLSKEQIITFLNNKGGFLANYSCSDPDGKTMTAAEAIYDRAFNNKVNPKFILVLLQKEQSLIEDSSPTQRQLDWAVGYGCPDGDGCNSRWQGFWKQVNSASLQFKDYMDNPQLYTFKAGQTYTINNTNRDPMVVTPVNQATAALYNYTPHVYNGNYNFFKIWQRYFTRNYPDGSLLQANGEIGVWLIQNGQKRPFVSKGALTSRYDINKIIMVNKSDLDKYEKGAPIKFPQYSLVRSPRGTIFLLVDDKKRGFTSGEAFRKIGFNPDEVMDASWEDIDSYEDGIPITATSTYAFGALLQNKKTGGVYWVSEDTKYPILDRIFLTTKFKNRKLTAVAPADLDLYITGDPYTYGDGEIIKTADSPAVYIISNKEKKAITSGEIFEGLGYKWKNVLTVPNKILALYPEGTPITQVIGDNNTAISSSN